MVRRIIWSVEARNSRKSIYDYWNARNKSKAYSKKLDGLFNENLKTVAKIPEFGHTTKNENIRFVIVSHFEIIYNFTTTEIVVLDIWDTRQNPKNFPL